MSASCCSWYWLAEFPWFHIKSVVSRCIIPLTSCLLWEYEVNLRLAERTLFTPLLLLILMAMPCATFLALSKLLARLNLHLPTYTDCSSVQIASGRQICVFAGALLFWFLQVMVARFWTANWLDDFRLLSSTRSYGITALPLGYWGSWLEDSPAVGLQTRGLPLAILGRQRLSKTFGLSATTEFWPPWSNQRQRSPGLEE